SAVHAHVVLAGDIWYLRDAGSRNGTWQGGERVLDDAPIASGARIRIGAVSLYFVAASIAAPPRRRRRTTQPVGPTAVRVQVPGGDNVRELVCRVRKKLAAVGGGGLVQSKPNVGYRIAAPIYAA